MRTLAFFLFLLIFLLLSGAKAFATTDPLSRENNIIGIHILFTSEINDAAHLINSNGGDWGYVTIPIQYSDRDLEKWQKFMDDTKRLHVIPILRLSTTPHFKDTSVWRKPSFYDIIDFANFLDSLEWPTKNKYVVIFNEVNRFDEWGGENPDPAAYSEILSFAIETFKSRSEDFYVISAGLDNAAPNAKRYMSNFNYLRRMASYNPEAMKKVDGIGSHSYPNPSFSASPNTNKTIGVASYKFEADLVRQYTGEEKKIFITETGWSSEALPEGVIADYISQTVREIWGKDEDLIVAVTPFLLNSQGGPFDKFSFIRNGKLSPFANAYYNVVKEKGNPELEKKDNIKEVASVLGVRDFDFQKESINPKLNGVVKFYLKSIFGI